MCTLKKSSVHWLKNLLNLIHRIIIRLCYLKNIHIIFYIYIP
jgi:hypothetical protein